MSAPRTVVVHTGDHGDVTIPEPFWCLGNHAAEAYRVDIEHQGEEIPFVIDTACHGPVELLKLSLFQRPFNPDSPRKPMVAVVLDDWHEFNSAQLADFADTLVAFSVGPLHQLIERLQLLEMGIEP